MFDPDIQVWLEAQPLNAEILLDDERIYLKRYPSGAELGAYLIESYTPVQLRTALLQGFSNALSGGAGLARSADGDSLLLTHWLPGVNSWPQAADALEALLNQLVAWRAALASPAVKPITAAVGRNEHRLRMLLAEGK